MTDELPREHKNAIGTTFYTAMGATNTWDKVNATGALLSMLLTSATAADNHKDENMLNVELRIWGDAMRFHEDDHGKNRAAFLCQKILGRIGALAYKYGQMPAGGFKLTSANAQEGGNR